MAWTSPRTWTALESVTAAIMNTHVRDNLNFLKDSGVQRLASYGLTSVTNSTTETTLATTSVAAAAMSTTRALRFTAFITVATDAGGARNVNFRVKFGGTTHLSGNTSFAVNSTFYIRFEVLIINTATNAQKILGSMVSASTAGGASWNTLNTTSSTIAGATGAIDTTSAQTFAISAQQDTAAVGFATTLTAGELELV
jgi:hypothetical protein